MPNSHPWGLKAALINFLNKLGMKSANGSNFFFNVYGNLMVTNPGCRAVIREYHAD